MGPARRGITVLEQKPMDTKKTALRLLGYWARNPLVVVLVFLCLLLSVGADLGATYYMRSIINRFIYFGATDIPGLMRSTVLLISINLCGALFTYSQSAITVSLAQRGMKRLRQDMFDHLQTLPLRYFDGNSHGELMSRFTNDADNVQLCMEQSVVALCSSVLTFAGLVTMLLYLNRILFLSTALIVGLDLLCFKVMAKKSGEYYRHQQKALGEVNGEIQEMMEGLRVVKAFSHEAQAEKVFREKDAILREAAINASFYSGVVMPLTNNLMNVGFALTAGLGGLLSLLRGFDLGGLFVYLQLCRKVGQPIEQVSHQMTSILSALAGAERIFRLIDTEPEDEGGAVALISDLQERRRAVESSVCLTPDAALPSWLWRIPKNGRLTVAPTGNADFPWGWHYAMGDDKPRTHPIRGRLYESEDCWYQEVRGAVRFQNVRFSYVEGKEVLKGITVYANPGQKIAFVGSTGAGKTTIANLISRFYEIAQGHITYDGMPLNALRKDDLRRSLSIVLQDTHLFSGTIYDNIRYGRPDATDEECKSAAKLAEADGFIRRLPGGYDALLEGDGETISQGQRQLLAIARAALAASPVLILDEATSSVDTRTEELIAKGMDALMSGRTVFVIAHRLNTVRSANCICVIEGGEILEKGTHDELVAQKGRYYELYTGQRVMD
jgi:ATP-binding cassette subfamily B protein